MNVFCTICATHLHESAQLRATKCGHLFHADCIAAALNKQPRCPECRTTCPPKSLIRLALAVDAERNGREMRVQRIVAQLERELQVKLSVGSLAAQAADVMAERAAQKVVVVPDRVKVATVATQKSRPATVTVAVQTDTMFQLQLEQLEQKMRQQQQSARSGLATQAAIPPATPMAARPDDNVMCVQWHLAQLEREQQMKLISDSLQNSKAQSSAARVPRFPFPPPPLAVGKTKAPNSPATVHQLPKSIAESVALMTGVIGSLAEKRSSGPPAPADQSSPGAGSKRKWWLEQPADKVCNKSPKMGG